MSVSMISPEFVDRFFMKFGESKEFAALHWQRSERELSIKCREWLPTSEGTTPIFTILLPGSECD